MARHASHRRTLTFQENRRKNRTQTSRLEKIINQRRENGAHVMQSGASLTLDPRADYSLDLKEEHCQSGFCNGVLTIPGSSNDSNLETVNILGPRRVRHAPALKRIRCAPLNALRPYDCSLRRTCDGRMRPLCYTADLNAYRGYE